MLNMFVISVARGHDPATESSRGGMTLQLNRRAGA